MIQFLEEKGFNILNLGYSPIKGRNGNIEFLVHFWKKCDYKCYFNETIVYNVVNEAHNNCY